MFSATRESSNKHIMILSDIKSLICLMLGTMIGTIRGLLFAPAKGTNTRKELPRKG